MQKILFDRRHMRKCAKRFTSQNIDSLTEPLIEEIEMRVAVIKRKFKNALFIGHYGHTRTYENKKTELERHIERILFADIAHLKDTYPPKPALLLDEEALPFKENAFDCIISCLTLHSINHLPQALTEIKRVLQPDGVFLAVLPCGDNLHQLRHAFIEAESALTKGAYARIPPFATLYDLSLLLQKTGFALPVVDRDIITLRHSSMQNFITDMHLWGWMGAYAPTYPLRRDVLGYVETLYRQNYRDEEGYFTTHCELAWLSGWKPHASQPKPLKPGSAQHSLADILKKAPK